MTDAEQRAENERVAHLKATLEADLQANDAQLVAEEKRTADAARYEALARKHGADLSEEEFNEALRKVGRRSPT